MPDREKIIKGLECCVIQGFNCYNCTYGDATTDLSECHDVLLKDALELLKEQEPRVLTWDEVERAEVCWLEERGWEETYAELHAADWNPEYYGKEIRCWNYKPTKEQMEAVKWDE